MEKYAFLMVDYNMPDYIKNIQKAIPEDELYIPEDPDSKFSYGLETECHVTLAPCLDTDVDLESLKSYLKPLSEYRVMLSNVSMFENEEYDVLKCDVVCDALKNTNKSIADNFELHTEFKKYHPHMTIAYLKKGTASKYIKHVINEPVFMKPIYFSFGYFDENEEYKRITFSK